MLSIQTVEPNTLELLKRLMQEPLLSTYRLVGGTSLALQYGHRCSIDLDFFGQPEIDADELLVVLQKYGTVQALKVTPNIKIYLLNGVKVDFVNYSYPWIDEAVVEEGFRLASPRDIAAMKINALEGRGTRKDFIDVHELLKHFSLAQILDFYKQKYPEHSIFRAIMSMSYFDDAELNPMPQMFVSDGWEEMKQGILRAIDSYQREQKFT